MTYWIEDVMLFLTCPKFNPRELFRTNDCTVCSIAQIVLLQFAQMHRHRRSTLRRPGSEQLIDKCNVQPSSQTWLSCRGCLWSGCIVHKCMVSQQHVENQHEYITENWHCSVSPLFSGGCCGSRQKKTRVGGWAWAWWLVTDVQRLSLEVSDWLCWHCIGLQCHLYF